MATFADDCSSEYATDIADAYPDKRVTLMHSRERLLPKYDAAMHDHSKLPSEYLLPCSSLIG